MVIIDLKNGGQILVPNLGSITMRKGLLICMTEAEVFAVKPDDVKSIYIDAASRKPSLLHRMTIGSVIDLYRALRSRRTARDRQRFLAASSLKAKIAQIGDVDVDGTAMRRLMAAEDGEIGLAEWARAISKLPEPEEAQETAAAASDGEVVFTKNQSTQALIQMLEGGRQEEERSL